MSLSNDRNEQLCQVAGRDLLQKALLTSLKLNYLSSWGKLYQTLFFQSVALHNVI